jgi:hypothetical protein
MTARAGALALACTMVLLAPAPAGASSVTNTQLRVLAAQAAAGSTAALAELRSVDSVDGQPAHLAAALSTSDGNELTTRLRALAAPGQSGGARLTSAQAQAAAAAVLHQRQYGRAPLPDPVGTAFTKVGHFIGKLASKVPGGPVVFWIVVAAILLAAATLGARRMMRRLDPAARAATAHDGITSDDPRALERAADAAEARHAYDDAIRLRFQAGLLMLGERGRLAYRPSLLTGEARRELHSETFDELAAHFEQVAYAHAAADEHLAADAREGWRAVLGSGNRERR